jgi:hypothetical protein
MSAAQVSEVFGKKVTVRLVLLKVSVGYTEDGKIALLF